jgi:lipoprotein-anchoring transpeptidase ErfK/SrfK
MDMTISARALATMAALGGLAAVLSACSPKSGATWHGTGTEPAPVAAATVTAPADGATDVPTAGELTLTGPAATSATVAVTDGSGTTVDGARSADGSTWVPATQLKYATTYTAAVTAPASDGKSQTTKSTFTTMKKPGKLVSVSTAMADGQVYGVAMPVVVRFASAVPQAQRASVERRLFVTSDPPQVGVWSWFSGTEVHFRPKEYWQEGTKLSVRLATGGLSFGGNAYGAKDVTVQATIGDKVVITTDNATHTMTVTQHDQVVKTIPVSLGKAKTPSSSGAMVIMTKNATEVFQSTDPADPYRLDVKFAQRLTSSGQYIHAAPWSVGDQGKRNVSHGCTNVSDANAKYLFDLTHVGDPVIVRGTERALDWGNGWTDWNRSFEEFATGSALPAPTA